MEETTATYMVRRSYPNPKNQEKVILEIQSVKVLGNEFMEDLYKILKKHTNGTK